MTRTWKRIDASDVPADVVFVATPADQGQMVQVEYGVPRQSMTRTPTSKTAWYRREKDTSQRAEWQYSIRRTMDQD